MHSPRAFPLIGRGIGFLLSVLLASASWLGAAGRETVALDDGWRFSLGDFNDAKEASFPDQSWRIVNLPHDWSIEGRTDPKSADGGIVGFFPTGLGWYRLHFAAPEQWRGRRVRIEFDGVYHESQVWLNGQLLGGEPHGYASFGFDLTPALLIGGSNVLAVRVDNSKQKNTHWYSGSGIYRHVRLVVHDAVHVVPWGVFVSTPKVSAESAMVEVEARVGNAGDKAAAVVVRTEFFDPQGKSVGQVETAGNVDAGGEAPVRQSLKLDSPSLWSPATPVLYRAVTQVRVGDQLRDEVATTFGVRALAWSAERGFEINGSPVELAGGCVHHDNGGLGAAAFDRAEERKVELLKAAGFNAVRSACKPPSPAFLDACDRLGMLVIVEAFDAWELPKNTYDYSRFFPANSERNLDAIVRRDRNHPSVILWTIGNEIKEQYTERGADIAVRLATQVRRLDPTRPVTQAIHATAKNDAEKAAIERLRGALDIVGFNYNLEEHAIQHALAPKRVMVATESNFKQIFRYRRIVAEHPYAIGDFTWTAEDHLGEELGRLKLMGDPKGDLNTAYPWYGSRTGDLDLDGDRRPHSYYRNIVWGRGDVLHLSVLEPDGPVPFDRKAWDVWTITPAQDSWTWPVAAGTPLQVVVYSNADSVRLYLDDRLVGEAPTTLRERQLATFPVPYAPGTLRAEAIKDGRVIATETLRTAGKAAAIRLKADRDRLHADGQDLAFISVEITDATGARQPQAANALTFELEGPGEIIAVQNANLKRAAVCFHDLTIPAYLGRALVVVRMSHQPGALRLKATSPGLPSASMKLLSEALPKAP